MTYVLDTHIFIWVLFEPKKLQEEIHEILADTSNTIYVSAVSFWEIAIKSSLGKVQLPKTKPEELIFHANKAGLSTLDLSSEHCAFSGSLAYYENHKDPFDRLLIYQCISLGFVLISADAKFEQYTENGLLLIRN